MLRKDEVSGEDHTQPDPVRSLEHHCPTEVVSPHKARGVFAKESWLHALARLRVLCVCAQCVFT